MQLKQIKTNAKNIKFTGVYNSDSDNVEAEETRSIVCTELPTPEFGEAMQRLTMVVVDVLNLGGSYVNGMIIRGFSMSYTSAGTASMSIEFDKVLDNLEGVTHSMKTPFFRIEEASDGDSGSMFISQRLKDFCDFALVEARNYALGQRSQTTFAQFAEENGALSKQESAELTLDA